MHGRPDTELYAQDKEYVIRFGQVRAAFERDLYAWERIAAPGIPIPSVREIGAMGGLAFAISERVAGRHLWSLDPAEHRRLLPQALDVLDRIHALAVQDTSGYGRWARRQRGKYPTWRAYIGAAREDVHDFPEDWPALVEGAFHDRDLWKQAYARMLELAEYCPEERWLLHGDYEYDNVFAADGWQQWSGSACCYELRLQLTAAARRTGRCPASLSRRHRGMHLACGRRRVRVDVRRARVLSSSWRDGAGVARTVAVA